MHSSKNLKHQLFCGEAEQLSGYRRVRWFLRVSIGEAARDGRDLFNPASSPILSVGPDQGVRSATCVFAYSVSSILRFLLAECDYCKQAGDLAP